MSENHRSYPATPANRTSLHPPLTPTRVPLPPSASNLFNQNNFSPSHNSRVPPLNRHHDTPPHLHRFSQYYNRDPRAYTHHPAHRPNFPQPSFYQVPFYPPYHNVPFYSPYHHQHQPQQPQTQYQQPVFSPIPVPIFPISDTVVQPLPASAPVLSSTPSSRTLPTVTHIPILSGRSDFGAWNDGVRALIQHLGYTGHISTPPISGVTPCPERIPTYAPVLSADPTAAELDAYKVWWEGDNVVTHILLARLHATVRAILPSDDDDDVATPRTSRTIYMILRKSYSVHGHASGSALYTELRNLQCGSRVQEFVTRWRGGISQLRSARHPFSVRDVIESFLDRLPASVPYQILRFKYMNQIDDVPVNDVGFFFRITDEVLDIDSLHKRTTISSSLRHPPSSRPSLPLNPHTPPIAIPMSTPIPTVSATRPVRSSLTCTNCHAIGHTGDRCFKPGGGLEGKREEYLGNLNRAQAHLAQLTEIIEGNMVDSDGVSQPLPLEPDIIVDPLPAPAFSALSLIPITSSESVDAVVNDDMFFELYFGSSSKSLLALSAIPSVDPLFESLPSVAFSAASFPYNSVLDSGCTHHIFRDRSLFWSYDATRATPVKTANCGFLPTLARGSVRFRVVSGQRSVVFVLNDCLHAPDAPINLISVGALTEKGAVLTFAPSRTSISFPPTHPVLPDFSFDAFLLHRLSFLHCDFVLPSVAPSPPPSLLHPLYLFPTLLLPLFPLR